MAARRLIIVVGSGGVGKTTLAASLAAQSAGCDQPTLVMTFDPSIRLKDALGVGTEAQSKEVPVSLPSGGVLHAGLLDARSTFDRLVERYSEDDNARDRILNNRFYDNLSGSLSGVLEYMAVERLFEVNQTGKYHTIILDTPPTRQALDFLEAPDRIVNFLNSGALRIALKPWFDDGGHLRPTSRFGVLGRNVEAFLDRMVGLKLLRDMADFFQAFGPLFQGFEQRAIEVKKLLRSKTTTFVLVSGPARERVADTLFFARRLTESGHNLGPVIVNRVHSYGEATPEATSTASQVDGAGLISWLGCRDRRGVEELRSLMEPTHPVVAVPLLAHEPTGLQALEELGRLLHTSLVEAGDPLATSPRQ
ncbi:MAG: ArsA family ATPase [bacterium]|nr:ArsA family ATPase [bacterium]